VTSLPPAQAPCRAGQQRPGELRYGARVRALRQNVRCGRVIRGL